MSFLGKIERALNEEILDLWKEDAFLEHQVVELVYIFGEKSTASV